MYLFFLLFIPLVRCHTRSPIILVPGTGGNQLEAKLHNKRTSHWYCDSSTDSYFNLWLSISSLFPIMINCWVDNIKLVWDMVNMTVKSPPGVYTRVPGFGGTSTLETLDASGLVKYMKPLVDFFRSIGYKSGKDIRGAPYDFRYAPENMPDNYYDKLKKLFEETFNFNNNTKVTIISHSYGCIVSQYFLSLQTKEWKNKYVKQWIPLAGPFGGTKHEVHLYSSGYAEGNTGMIVNRLKLRGEQRSSTSNLWMLPSLSAWPSDALIVKTPKKNYYMADMDEFLNDIGFPEGAKMRFHISNSSGLMSKAPGVPVYCFYGYLPESSIGHLEFHNDRDFPDNPSLVVLSGGDGTVNAESLSLCKQFSSMQKEESKVTELNGVKHSDIITSKTVLESIRILVT